MSNDEQNSENNFIERIKESPRTVSALIIILIVAAAIYAFSGDRNKQANQDQQNNNNNQVAVETAQTEATKDEQKATTSPAATTKNGKKTAVKSTTTIQATPVVTTAVTPLPLTKDELTQNAKNLPEEQKQSDGYVETAQKGDGLTHLARRAATRWLVDNQPSYELTQAHRIYIEDYIQKKLDGNRHLQLGDQKTISFELIKQAVDSAGQLNSQQLQHLQQYTTVLTR